MEAHEIRPLLPRPVFLPVLKTRFIIWRWNYEKLSRIDRAGSESLGRFHVFVFFGLWTGLAGVAVADIQVIGHRGIFEQVRRRIPLKHLMSNVEAATS